MNISVKARIVIVLSVLVCVNIAVGALSWYLYSSAARSGAQAREAAERARLAAAASQRVTEFNAAARDLVLGLSHSTPSAERSRLYGALIGYDPDVDRAISRVASATKDTAGGDSVGEWAGVKETLYAWINEEARLAGAELRITRNPDGSYRDSNDSDLELPADVAAVPSSALRNAVRDRVERFQYATLGAIVKRAEGQAAAMAVAEARTRAAADRGTATLIAVGVIIAVFLGVLLYSSIAIPLGRATDYARRVARGERDIEFAQHSTDEIGVLTRAVDDMRASLIYDVSLMREMAGAVMFTAEGVEHIVCTAIDPGGPADDTRLQAALGDVRAQVEILKDLSRQMLGM